MSLKHTKMIFAHLSLYNRHFYLQHPS